MSTQTVSPDAVLSATETLSSGDQVRLATPHHDYKTPVEVEAVDRVEWESPSGGWPSAEVVLAGAYRGSDPHVVTVTDRFVRYERGDTTLYDLERFEIVDASDNHDCPECSRSFDSKQGLAVHRGQNHNPGDELSERAVEDLDAIAREKNGDDGGLSSAEAPSPDQPDATEQELIGAAEDVDTLEEYAEAIDAGSIGRARTIAMNVGVYTDLEDNPEAYGRGWA